MFIAIKTDDGRIKGKIVRFIQKRRKRKNLIKKQKL